MRALSNFYSQLIEPIPTDLTAMQVIQGEGWSLVQSELGVGLATTYLGGQNAQQRPNLKGINLKTLASWINSWNFPEASLGMAAINSFWNTKEQLSQNFGISKLSPELHLLDHLKQAQLSGKKIASIGHFPFLDQLQQEQLYILEMNPSQFNELPWTASEYVLDKAQIILITGSTLINKSYEALKRLIRHSETWLLGPSTPFTPNFKNEGFNYLGGLLVQDADEVKKLVRAGKRRELMNCSGVCKIQVNFET